MRTSTVLHLTALLMVATALSLPVAPTSAATSVYAPMGTQVGLLFITPVNTSKIATGNKVQFKVAADVIVNRYVVIRRGTTMTGTVTRVQKPGMYGQSAGMTISLLAVTAVDRRPVNLTDVIISSDTVKNRGGAAGASVAGAIILGPVGLLAGALVRGGDIQVPAGTEVTQTTKTGATIRVS
jgi:hypothetical protein